MNCSGSTELLAKLTLPDTDEPEYRQLGTAAHTVGAVCLTDKIDAWETIGTYFNESEVNANMADAVQVYLDKVRPLIAKATSVRIEQKMYRPDLHPSFYGTADLALYFEEEALLDVTDYKHGEGIFVDVEWNPQIMYYAYGLLDQYPGVRRVRLRIVQPRNHEGPAIREWEISAEDLCAWAEDELLPAMNRKAMDKMLDAGPWCRFCPAKLVCPLLTSLFGAAAKADPKQIINLSNESIGRSYQYIPAVKFYIKALEAETFRLNNAGKDVPGTKMVPKKSNRIYKDGAEQIMIARFGNDAYETRALKSPAQIEALGPDGASFVAEWAYTPFTGLTVALASDRRQGVRVQSLDEKFKGAAPAEDPDVTLDRVMGAG